MKLKLFTDGGARNNPGPAAIGVVIYNDQDEVVKKIKKYIGMATNNIAEYEAIITGLKEANVLGADEVVCYLDSELVVKQVKGEYKVKEQNLAEKYLQVWKLKSVFKSAEFHHIRREKNTVADSLVNEALDEAAKS